MQHSLDVTSPRILIEFMHEFVSLPPSLACVSKDITRLTFGGARRKISHAAAAAARA